MGGASFEGVSPVFLLGYGSQSSCLDLAPEIPALELVISEFFCFEFARKGL